MIDTIMALWNLMFHRHTNRRVMVGVAPPGEDKAPLAGTLRARSFRAMAVLSAFLLICISISLLLVTIGNAWQSLLLQGNPTNNHNNIVSPATAQSSAAPGTNGTPVTIKPISTASAKDCFGTPTISKRATLQKSASTKYGRNRNHPGKPTPTLTISRSYLTPTFTPISITTPTPSPTSTPTLTPTPTNTPTPGITLTPTPTPTDTPTTTPTATMTPTDTVTPTDTPSPHPTSTDTPTPTPTDTPTVTATASGSPTPITTRTSAPNIRGGGISSDNQHGGGGGGGGDDGGNGSPPQTNCLGDSVQTDSADAALANLEGYLWMILCASTLATVLFTGVIYRLHRKHRLSGSRRG